ncbi:DUF3025 domain-containing protein [Luteibacter sp. UNCMF366Tsu5.1]|uniref:DUF3025 domain-containing protein n=1 Tax=Luteibacter sp. UNCMF366Tsu5.1 TaxID=1502758 RepID=UPI000908BF01|nr:DUF3025 domain-containing protein [Luteibacter sp. UNCMF366Tsu5.1]SFW16840.1 Protein of unknown function [Luteibacter sp. UNCMF366Tsu5.1]
MRYVAPTRDALDRRVLVVPPLSDWFAFAALMEGPEWPDVDALNALWPSPGAQHFVMQDKALLADGLHYEERIARRGAIATRPANWHDLFNAFIWLRHGAIKRALNARQMAEIAVMGPRERSRAQYALTHFDEAGLIVTLRDPAMLDAWNAHDWPRLFWSHREAWLRGDARVDVFGHALLEHALTPGKLLVGKALVVMRDGDAAAICAEAIASGAVLNDPLELRPLPVSGVPGWHADAVHESFYTSAPCFQPLRAGRVYPAAL